MTALRKTTADSALSLSRRAFVRLGAAAAVAGVGTSGLLSGCSALDAALLGTRQLADDTGRLVELPAEHLLRAVYYTSPLAQVFCFTLAPDLLGGSASSFSDEQLEFLPTGTSDLPYMGALTHGGHIDIDMLHIQDVQAIFSISGVDLTDINIEDSLKLEAECGIPVFLIDGSFDQIGNTYRLLGEALGRRERAEELAQFCERIYREVTEAVARVPEDERVRYYFAEGPEGILTEPDSSQYAHTFHVAGGVNVAAEAPLPVGEAEYARVTVEQVAEWDPDIVIAWDWETREGADHLIRNSSEWQAVRAVREGRLRTMPNLPFAFCDRPPGVNRFLGIQWLANLMYPDYYDIDIVQAVRDFCATCYWREITPDQARRILLMDA